MLKKQESIWSYGINIFYYMQKEKKEVGEMLLASAHAGIKTESYTEVYRLGLYKEY